jgi:alpha-1,6-mannosyltransferase
VKICDLTQSYTPTSGGVRTYLLEKQAYVDSSSDHEHLLVVPGSHDTVRRSGRLTVVTVAGPTIPGCAPYRFMLRMDKVRRALTEFAPDVVEVGSPYLLPWSAFRHRRQTGAVISGFYHTDFPRAYVETTMRPLVGGPGARRLRRLASRYARAVYRRMNVTFAASTPFLKKLRRWKVPNVTPLALGVDLETFNPRRRRDRIRQELGVADHELLMVFAGRLDSEKRVDVLYDAFCKLPETLHRRLLLIGEGPKRHGLERSALRDRRLVVLPYVTDRTSLAELLASSDMYVSAAPHETFGLSVVEAQACGLAVAGVRAGAMAERVPPSAGVLASGTSADSLAGAMWTLSTNGFRERGATARRLVEERFAWTRTFDTQFAVYERMLAARRRDV